MHFNVGFGAAGALGVPFPVVGGMPSTGIDAFVGVATLFIGVPAAAAAAAAAAAC